MRVEFATEGGVAFFPGLSRPTVIDSAELPQDEAEQLHELMNAAQFFDLPAASRTLPKGAADYRQYTITVQEGRRRHTVRLVDPVDDPNLEALLSFLRRHATRPATLGESSAPKARTSRSKRRTRE